jgi:hypothetical protein
MRKVSLLSLVAVLAVGAVSYDEGLRPVPMPSQDKNQLRDPGNWFLHIYTEPSDPTNTNYWTVFIDHSYHVGELSISERQFSRGDGGEGGFMTLKDALKPLRAHQGLSEKNPDEQQKETECVVSNTALVNPPWYVHRAGTAQANYTYTINHNYVSTTSASSKHCPTDEGTPPRPVYPGYPFNEFNKACDAVECMQADTCPPCVYM